MSLLRSALFSTPLIALSTIVMDLISMAFSFFDRSGNSAHHVARLWAKMLLAESFIRVRAEGLEKLDRNRNYVFVSNHGSFMDIPAILSTLPHQFRFFAKISLYRIPFLGWHLRWAGHLPVDRSNARASLKSMTEGARIISERRISVLLFPEGGPQPGRPARVQRRRRLYRHQSRRPHRAHRHRRSAGTAAHGLRPYPQRTCSSAGERPHRHQRHEDLRSRRPHASSSRRSCAPAGGAAAGTHNLMPATRPYGSKCRSRWIQTTRAQRVTSGTIGK